MNKYLFTTITFLIISLFAFSVFNPVSAQEDEATDSASVEELNKAVENSIKKALDEENLEKAKETLAQAKERAVVGVIDSLAQNQITVRVNPDKPSAEYNHQISYSETSEILRRSKSIDPEDLAIGDYIIAMGLPTTDSSLDANRIVVSSYVQPTVYAEVIFATITEIDLDDETILLTNSHQILDDPLDVTTKTDILSNTQEELSLEDLQPGQKVTIVITINTKKKTATLNTLITFPTPDLVTSTPSPTDTDVTSEAFCGDNICQNVACFGQDCPVPESPETCPVDCTE